MSITLYINGNDVCLEEYYGWSDPGRTPSINFKERKKGGKPPLILQIFEISNFLDKVAKEKKDLTVKEINNGIRYTYEAFRQIKPIMDKIGFLNEEIKINQQIPTEEPISIKGKAFNELTKLRLEDEANYINLSEIQQKLWAKIFSSYKTDNPNGLYPVKAILETIKRNSYLVKTEWDIMTSFVTENDNKSQGEIVDRFIQEYRNNPDGFADIQRVAANKKGPKGDRASIENNYNTYTKNLVEAGLLVKHSERRNGKKTDRFRINKNAQSIIEMIVN